MKESPCLSHSKNYNAKACAIMSQNIFEIKRNSKSQIQHKNDYHKIPLLERNLFSGLRDHSEENDKILSQPKFSKTKERLNKLKVIEKIYRWQVPEHLKSRLPHVAEMHITHGIPSPKDIIPNSNAEFSIQETNQNDDYTNRKRSNPLRESKSLAALNKSEEKYLCQHPSQSKRYQKLSLKSKNKPKENLRMSNENLKLHDRFIPKTAFDQEENTNDYDDKLSKDLSTNERSNSIAQKFESEDSKSNSHKPNYLPSVNKINANSPENSNALMSMNVKSITEVINRTIHHKNQKHLRSNSKQKLLIDKTKVRLIEKQASDPIAKSSI